MRSTIAGRLDQQCDDGGMGRKRTLMAKNNVSAMEPKYAVVKGSRGPEIRCLA